MQPNNISQLTKKWYFKAITAKSEENRLCLKFDFKFSRVSQNISGAFLIPYLETRIFKNQKTGRV